MVDIDRAKIRSVLGGYDVAVAYINIDYDPTDLTIFLTAADYERVDIESLKRELSMALPYMKFWITTPKSSFPLSPI